GAGRVVGGRRFAVAQGGGFAWAVRGERVHVPRAVDGAWIDVPLLRGGRHILNLETAGARINRRQAVGGDVRALADEGFGALVGHRDRGARGDGRGGAPADAASDGVERGVFVSSDADRAGRMHVAGARGSLPRARAA